MSGPEELVEHVVLVGREDQTADRQAHAPGDVPGEDVAEIAARHREIDHVALVARCCEIALEIVDDLRRDARPVDRIDRAETMAFLERSIAGNGLDQVLAIVEHTIDRHVEDIGVGERIHLRGLKRTHPAAGREHEHVDAALAPERVLGRGARIARGRTQYVERRALPCQDVLEELPEELQRDVLERQRRSVGDVQQMQSRLERGERRDLVAPEDVRRIGAIHDRLEVRRRDVVGVARDDRERQVAIGQRPQARQVRWREDRIRLGHGQPAVRREALEEDCRERSRRHAATRADIAHRHGSS